MKFVHLKAQVAILEEKAEELVKSFLAFCRRIGGRPHRYHYEASCYIPKNSAVDILGFRSSTIPGEEPYAMLEIHARTARTREPQMFRVEAEQVSIWAPSPIDLERLEFNVSKKEKVTHEGLRISTENKALMITFKPMDREGKWVDLKVLQLVE